MQIACSILTSNEGAILFCGADTGIRQRGRPQHVRDPEVLPPQLRISTAALATYHPFCFIFLSKNFWRNFAILILKIHIKYNLTLGVIAQYVT